MEREKPDMFLSNGCYEIDSGKKIAPHLNCGRGKFFTPAHFHHISEFVFVESGKIKATVNGETKILERGDTVAVNPFDVHSYEDLEVSDTYVLTMQKKYADRIFGSNKKNLNYFQQRRMDEAEREKLLNLLREFYENSSRMNLVMLDGYIGIILGTILDFHRTKEVHVKHVDFIMRLLVYIEDNLSEPLTIETLAAEFGYTKNYLSKLFCKYIGMHFREYINMRRIEKVETERQKGGDKNMLEIVMRCGFGSTNTYYRAFKKFGGENILPSEQQKRF